MRLLNVYLYLLAGLTLTGLALMLIYVPHAGAPIQVTSAHPGVTVGYILRGIHFWAAQVVLLTALTHMVRMAAGKTGRKRIGWAAVLFVLIGLLWFTGMILPWDQLPYRLQVWWPGVSAQSALMSVYLTHSLALSLLTLLLLMIYVHRTRRDLAASL